VRIEEALKFLNMAVYCQGNIPVSREIDDIWHSWILETKEYSALCDSLQGRRYIHHCSNTYLECAESGAELPVTTLENKIAMLGNYVLNYGPFEADRINYWPFAAYLVRELGMTVDGLNEWLSADSSAATAS
jgi:hypothetical protein